MFFIIIIVSKMKKPTKEVPVASLNVEEPDKKKRGRKKKEPVEVEPASVSVNPPLTNIINIVAQPEEQVESVNAENAVKKRGRRPKGGKLVAKQPDDKDTSNPPVANVIVHLKCKMSDMVEFPTSNHKIMFDQLEYNPSVPPEIQAYNESDIITYSNYAEKEEGMKKDTLPSAISTSVRNEVGQSSNQGLQSQSGSVSSEKDDDYSVNMKEINAKIKKLKVDLYKNNCSDKRSSCFWCTCPFDNPACYIPMYELDGVMYVYGSFCYPECAVAHLMSENMDDSMKFERYHLLMKLYGKAHGYKKSIKPAPNPYYTLDKFYGNLSIQEYRKLFKTDHLLMVVDKPLTRILPEIHEETDDAGDGRMGVAATGGNYKVKRQSEKVNGPSKSSIIKDKFWSQ